MKNAAVCNSFINNYTERKKGCQCWKNLGIKQYSNDVPLQKKNSRHQKKGVVFTVCFHYNKKEDLPQWRDNMNDA